MAITRNAKKAQRTSARKRVFNVRRKSQLHDAVKDVRDAVKAGKYDEARALLPKAFKSIDKGHKRGIIKKNTAARKKSRLALFVHRSSIAAK